MSDNFTEEDYRKSTGIISNYNGKTFEKVIVNFLLGNTNRQDEKGNPIKRKRFFHNQIVERGLTNNPDIHSQEDLDIEISHLNINIECKGTKLKYRKVKRKEEEKARMGYFKFSKNNFNDRLNLYAFIFGISKRFFLFLTRKEVLELFEKNKIKKLLAGEIKTLYLHQEKVVHKALFTYKEFELLGEKWF